MKAIVNGNIFTPREKIDEGVILIEDRTIHAVGRARDISIPSDAERIDARGLAIIPGLIDLHTFGCLGAQLTTAARAADDLAQFARNVARFGVTAFLISIPMGTPDEMAQMLAALADAIPNLRGGARCVGIHFEGPYLDPEQRGAFPRHFLREPSVEEMTWWLDRARGFVRVATLAPNLREAIPVADFLRERGVIPSLGHSSTGYEVAHNALAPRGPFALVTHMFNAMSGLHHRNPGVVGAVLASNVPAMLICDGEHVHPAVVKILVRAKTSERVILVTDSIAGAGMSDGEFSLFGQPVTVKNGRATLTNGTLAGSVLTLNRAVVNAREFAGISFNDALKMATANPARRLNLDSRGMISEGAEADVVVMEEMSGEVKMTMVGGQVVCGG